MDLEGLIASTISDAKPMAIAAFCAIVGFVITASLVEAWLSKPSEEKRGRGGCSHARRL